MAKHRRLSSHPRKKKRYLILKALFSLFISAIFLFGVLMLIPGVRKTVVLYANYFYFEKAELDPPSGYDIHGIDVSWYQLWIDWKTVKEQNVIQFAFIKATEGETLVDRAFKRNWRETKKHGIRRGAYHFFRPNKSGEKQARAYLKAVDFQKGDMAPVLDIEVLGDDKKKFYKEIDAWLKVVETETGKRPIIYSGRRFYADHLESRYSDYPFWVANYNRKKLRIRQRWHFWQHTDRAKIKGIFGKVDHNVFNGPLAELERLCF